MTLALFPDLSALEAAYVVMALLALGCAAAALAVIALKSARID